MKMKLWLLVNVFLGVFSANTWADEASLKKKIEAAYPKYKVDSIVKTPYVGLYEIFMGGQIIYADEKFSFLIAEGRLVDPKTKKDITSERLSELGKIDFNNLPLDQAIKVVKGNGSRKLVVFSDVDCPFCKRLERNELSNIDNVTVYTFLYPIESLHPDAANKSKLIWCAKDRAKAWGDWIARDILPETSGECKVPLDSVGALAHKLGVNSTPVMFFSDGRRLVGALPYPEIEEGLARATIKK